MVPLDPKETHVHPLSFIAVCSKHLHSLILYLLKQVQVLQEAMQCNVQRGINKINTFKKVQVEQEKKTYFRLYFNWRYILNKSIFVFCASQSKFTIKMPMWRACKQRDYFLEKPGYPQS